MSSYKLIRRTARVLTYVVLALSLIALTAELLPEVHAKLVVIPTLLLVVALCVIEIGQQKVIKSEMR